MGIVLLRRHGFTLGSVSCIEMLEAKFLYSRASYALPYTRQSTLDTSPTVAVLQMQKSPMHARRH